MGKDREEADREISELGVGESIIYFEGCLAASIEGNPSLRAYQMRYLQAGYPRGEVIPHCGGYKLIRGTGEGVLTQYRLGQNGSNLFLYFFTKHRKGKAPNVKSETRRNGI